MMDPLAACTELAHLLAISDMGGAECEPRRVGDPCFESSAVARFLVRGVAGLGRAHEPVVDTDLNVEGGTPRQGTGPDFP
jgi:hypothetical protein